MPRTSVVLSDSELGELRRIAEREGRGVPDLLHDAVRRLLSDEVRKGNGWRRCLDDAVAAIRQGVPADRAPQEIETDISSASAEVRKARRARRR